METRGVNIRRGALVGRSAKQALSRECQLLAIRGCFARSPAKQNGGIRLRQHLPCKFDDFSRALDLLMIIVAGVINLRLG